MSEQKSVSPLLDGFTIGTPVKSHFGVCCYPAVRENSERKYIVKAISVPASQTQLDALMITGAYQTTAAAVEYFRSQAEQLIDENEILKKLSRLDGFLPFEGCQMEPAQHNRIGYEVYFLSSFRLTLERYMHRHNVSHLEAVNLGIDLCQALAACRSMGMLYIDLKPSNIFIINKTQYKIGDLGFTPLDSIHFTPMPEKYRSCYTAPELLDDLAVLNTTVDTYALGMILYQIFNCGALPQDLNAPLPTPVNADEGMSAILSKACAPNPADRWKDPRQMGQALVDYMQSYSINNNPIMQPITGPSPDGTTYQTTPFPVPETPEPVPVSEEAPAEAVPEEQAQKAPPAEQDTDAASEEATKEAAAEDAAEEVAPQTVEAEPAAEQETSTPESQHEEGSERDDPNAPTLQEPEEGANEEPLPEQPAEEAVPAGQQETAPAEIHDVLDDGFAALGTGKEQQSESYLDGDRLDQELEELNKLLRTSEKPMPKTVKPQPNIEPVVMKHKKKRSTVGILFTIFFICLILAGSVWGYIYYTTEYIQTVKGISISEDLGKVTVAVDSDARPGLLSVVCTDPYGNSFTQNVRDGKAEFKQLTPGTFYTVAVEVSGLHKLTGSVSEVFTTEGTTNVVAFTAANGSVDGSVALNLVVEGHEPDQWQAFYYAEGEPELSKTFTGHSTVIENLVVGKTYTIRLESVVGGKRSAANGQNTVEFTATHLITAANLSIVSCTGGELVVKWDNSRDFAPEAWIVHCVGKDYDQVQEATETQAIFTGIDPSSSYTVEVTAKGMSQTSRISISANPVTLTGLTVDDSNPEELKLNWQFEGSAPEGGWLVTYTLDGGDLPSVAKTEGTSATVAPRIPGAVYHFSFQGAQDVTVINGAQSYSCPAAQVYQGHALSGNSISCQLLPTPAEEDWSFYTVDKGSYTQSFAAGQSISMVLSSSASFHLDAEDVSVLYVFLDEAGNALPELIGEQELNWHNMWIKTDYRHAELTVPTSPVTPGSYTLDVYFDGCAAASASLTVY